MAAAVAILREHSNNTPLHYREITARAIEKGLLVPKGNTPQTSMHSQLQNSLRFYSAGGGVFGLSEWIGTIFPQRPHVAVDQSKLLAKAKLAGACV